MKTPKQVDVAIGIVAFDSLLLICQRKPDGHLGGLWEFPGGKRDDTESMEQCLHRELKEELDIEVEIVTPLPPIEHEYPEVLVTLHPYLCRWSGGEPRAIASQQFAWVPVEQLREYELPAANEPLIQWLSDNLEHALADWDAAQSRAAELDSLRIRQVARIKQATIRFASYHMVGALGCWVAGIDLIWQAERQFRAGNSPAWVAFYLIAAGALEWWGKRFFDISRRYSREACRTSLPEPATPPDFSGLSDGSHVVRNLERMK
jgi:mutator protein MutT